MAKKKKILKILLYLLLICAVGTGSYFGIKYLNENLNFQEDTSGTSDQDKPQEGEHGEGEQEQPQEQQFLVTFEIENESQTYWQIVNKGEYASSPLTPTKEGYTFKGWAINNVIVELSQYPINSDTIFTAVFVSKITTDYVFNGSTLVKYNGSDKDVVVPSSYSLNDEGQAVEGNDIQIKTIAKNAFAAFGDDCKLESIVVAEGITDIGDWCFSNNSNLKSVSLPSTLKSLGTYCFVSCISLVEVCFSEGIENIEEGTFSNCVALSNITIPEGVISLGKNCFSNCTSLKSISLPETLEVLGEQCFYKCSALKEITLPENILQIGLACFVECSALEQVTILSKESFYIEEDAFNSTPAQLIVRAYLLEEFKEKNPAIADKFVKS